MNWDSLIGLALIVWSITAPVIRIKRHIRDFESTHVGIESTDHRFRLIDRALRDVGFMALSGIVIGVLYIGTVVTHKPIDPVVDVLPAAISLFLLHRAFWDR